MSLWDTLNIRKQLLKVIEWKDMASDLIVYRHPMENRVEIMNGCQLIVRESQAAILVSEGQVAEVFGPGRHKLETRNLPILTGLAGWKYGFDSPFKAEVYYINTKQFINQKWGTTNPIMMRDKEFGVVRIRGFGKYAYRVSDPVTMMKQIFGTNASYTTEGLVNHFKTMIVSGFSDAIAESGISALDLAANYKEFGAFLRQALQNDFNAFGIEVTSLIIENISLPEEVEKVLDQRTSMGIMSDKMGTFMQYQAAQAMRDAAQNPSGGVAGAGVGLGAGLGMASMFTESFKNAMKPTDKPAEAPKTEVAKLAEEKMKCPKCAAEIKTSAKFCPECGENLNTVKACSKCGHEMKKSAKFCPDCGEKA
jgi:membrane protease subunit (stomatin/prohibitin family)